eukprot:TRINITY_DN3448_c0_g1_i1.p1 TRINITY_DN3448_c0_g1~~TRINITY_DN3448_c0_g1_i1.p1  ORF type:complete len:106 (+),score=27.50 TRINITY_DN3448_c0_g1_i1:226-543(+)
MDIVEAKDKYEVQIDLPGIDKKDVKIEIEKNVLNISGERKKEIKEENEKFSRIERSYGKFQRSLRLPKDVDQEKVSAKQDNGILVLTLPKKPIAEPEKPKLVSVL